MPLFFVLKRPIEATGTIGVLTGVVGYLTYVWSQVDSVAAWCIAPYLGWLGFATYLSVRGVSSALHEYLLIDVIGRDRTTERLEFQRQGRERACEPRARWEAIHQ